MRSRILVGLIMGTVGGFAGWLVQESLVHYQAHMVNGDCIAVPLTTSQHVIMTLAVGGLIGLCLGAMDGIVEANGHKLRKGILIGFVAGFLLAGIGFQIGGVIYYMLGGNETVPQHASVIGFVQQLIARSCGLSLLGIAVGFGSSIASWSLPRMRNGAIGGLLGGLVGGFLFNLIPTAIVPVATAVGDVGCRDVGAPSRAVSFILIGGCTGFFIGLVQELMKDAWVKVLAGRNEGKDYILDRQINILGRNERADVPLYGDMNVGEQHAAIKANGSRHVLVDAGIPLGTAVNGQRVDAGGEQLLRDGDMIQIGQHRIMFHEKATASKTARQPSDAAKSASRASSVPMPSHLCPFCGAPKDINGKCLCNVAAGPPSTAVAQSPLVTHGSSFGSAALQAYGAPISSSGELPCRLVGIGGPYAGQGFALAGPNMTVGRAETCDVALPLDTTVSRSHARLVIEGAGLSVYDNGSSNGTFVNGSRVTAPLMVVCGDIVQFGSSKFQLE